MAKFTLKAALTAAGVGTFVEKTIKFRDAEGQEFEGEVLIKIISHDDVVNATDIFKVKNKQDITLDQLRKALVYQTVYEDEEKRFFPKISDTGTVSTEILNAMYDIADEVINFSGKNWISAKKKKDGVNSSSTELEEEQLPKPSEE